MVLLSLVLVGGIYVVPKLWDNYRFMAVRAKRAEGPILLRQICQAELAYFASTGSFATAGPTPQNDPDKRPQPFVSSHLAEWENLGWKPEGQVRCQFEVRVVETSVSNFQATALCDADGDTVFSEYRTDKTCEVQRVSGKNIF